ncbi:hypothetical protein ASPWEDRAFT_49779 [Aspergillus wentii DTO 134E9]|uniref:Uncharacterized protein n=1 Tax=Aspergillus wentii DTO 134E9 TaxID=1073089 RepID=A0A1L9RYA9_ASPWE|nr:uncharacterized protein ASPWEDRAFT_49779 [Aspergillus wentii DTO 134E9]KAI9931401.1 hypothetical protein MW887_009976 [Aspergillus wentii]OJJ39931.1 hypothetical protein ASPWEDRAFT_49779 [Aspergillus wentii DTO 134E9]
MKSLLFLSLLATATAIPVESDSLDDALVLLGDGSTQRIKKQDLSSLFTPPREVPHFLETHANNTNYKRGSDVELIIELPDEDFLGWDTAMSTVTHANEADVSLAIMSGQNIANSVSVSTGVDVTLVKDFLSFSSSIDYQHSVTSLVSGTATLTIPKNRWGCIVSNPKTHRRSGYVYKGTPGGASTFNHYQADSFEDSSYNYNGGKLSWVKGVVTTCLGDKYPLPRCLGQGTLE